VSHRVFDFQQEVQMQTIDEVMTKNPLTVDESAPVSDAARMMRDANIGDVLVTRSDGSVCGIVTDRDLALNVVAEGNDPASMVVRDVCNHTIESVASSDPVGKAVQVMSERAIRRLPVIDDGTLVGIVTLGDLAIERDPQSALANISEAPPNN
jgi:signal-transduction protein with cAMP-binding, CBS, and nucleotidyltransferase domain